MHDEEGLNLEFKRGLLSRKEIAEYAVGIGNEGGGWLVMGVTDRRPRSIVGVDRQGPAQLQRIRDSVMDSAGIRMDVQHFQTSDGWVLAISIPTRPRGQVFYTRSGKYLMRTGEGLRGMTPAEIERIRAEELSHTDFTAECVHVDWRAVLDPVEIQRLRRVLAENRREELARLGDNQLLRSLDLLRKQGGQLRVTRAAVLLLGLQDAFREFVPTHEVKLRFWGP